MRRCDHGRERLAARGWGVLIAVLAILPLAPVALAAQPSASPAAPASPVPLPLRPSGTAPLLLVLDASGSMRGDDGTGRSKMDAAKEALIQLVAELPEGAPVGLRLYGHRVPTDGDRAAGCQDSELVVPVAPLDRERLTQVVNGVQPTGFTPIGASLRAAGGDLPQEGPRTVVLISDGIDTCAPPDPCQMARELASGDVELRVESIGFQVDPGAAAQLRCIADATGGTFRAVDDAAGLLRALREYEVTGTPIVGGPSAERALLLEGGLYRDTIAVGQERWYAVDLRRGQVLRAVATVVGEPGGPVSPAARFSLDMGNDDILGSVACGHDEVRRIGQEARQVSFDGLAAVEGAICAPTGRSVVRLRLEDGSEPEDAEESVLAGVSFDVELLVNVVDTALPEPTPSPSPEAELVAAPSPPALGEGPDGGTQLVAVLGAVVLGAVVGRLVARRMGP